MTPTQCILLGLLERLREDHADNQKIYMQLDGEQITIYCRPNHPRYTGGAARIGYLWIIDNRLTCVNANAIKPFRRHRADALGFQTMIVLTDPNAIENAAALVHKIITDALDDN